MVEGVREGVELKCEDWLTCPKLVEVLIDGPKCRKPLKVVEKELVECECVLNY